MRPTVSVIIPVFNGIRYLPTFFDSLSGALPDGAEIVLVDDGSSEPVREVIPSFTKAGAVKVLRNERNLGYAAAVNRGFAAISGQITVQLNTDLILDTDCIHAMIRLMNDQKRVGIVGSKLIFPTTGLIQHIGMAFGKNSKKHVYFQLPADHPLCQRTRPMQVLTGATVAMSRQVLDLIGPLDERYYNYNEDIDHCLKACKKGLVNYTCAESIAYHWVSQSGPARFAGIREAEALFWSEWGQQYTVDLPRFLAESLSHLIESKPEILDYGFEGVNLCNGADDQILIAEALRHWPGLGDRIRSYKQSNNPDQKIKLPMVLPHWMIQNPSPYIYFTDRFRNLAENHYWFRVRSTVVEDEVIIDASGCAVMASEYMLASHKP